MVPRPFALGVAKVFWFQLFDPANGRASSAKHYGLLDTAGPFSGPGTCRTWVEIIP